MTREEMIAKLSEYCTSRPPASCFACPVRKVPETGIGCMAFVKRTDEELAACIEKITPVPVEEEPTTEPEPDEDVGIQHAEQMVLVSRDEMRKMEGRLLMLTCCTGATITEAIADELLFMAETIDRALSDDEGAVG